MDTQPLDNIADPELVRIIETEPDLANVVRLLIHGGEQTRKEAARLMRERDQAEQLLFCLEAKAQSGSNMAFQTFADSTRWIHVRHIEWKGETGFQYIVNDLRDDHYGGQVTRRQAIAFIARHTAEDPS